MKTIPTLADAPDFQPVNIEVELPEKLLLLADEKGLDLSKILRHIIMKEMGVEPAYPETAISIITENDLLLYQIN